MEFQAWTKCQENETKLLAFYNFRCFLEHCALRRVAGSTRTRSPMKWRFFVRSTTNLCCFSLLQPNSALLSALSADSVQILLQQLSFHCLVTSVECCFVKQKSKDYSTLGRFWLVLECLNKILKVFRTELNRKLALFIKLSRKLGTFISLLGFLTRVWKSLYRFLIC